MTGRRQEPLQWWQDWWETAELRGDEDIEGAVQDGSEKMISFKEEEELGNVKSLKGKYESCFRQRVKNYEEFKSKGQEEAFWWNLQKTDKGK